MKWLCLVACLFLVVAADAEMVLELHFDEGTGDQVVDTSGMENHGTVVGATWTDGKHGHALEFDGAGTHVQIPDAASLQITDQMTVAAWVSFDMLGASGNHDAIIAKASTWSFITFRRSDPAYQFAWWDSVAKNLMPNEPKWIVSEWVPEVNTWYHLAVTMVSEDTLRFFRDGEVITESAYPVVIPAGAGQPIRVGKGNGDSENMAGMVDEIAIFNTALEPEQVAALMADPAVVEPVGKLGVVWSDLKAQ